jgi:hypothetical protein
MDSLFSFPVGLFHPLQHAGLSRRSPSAPFRNHIGSIFSVDQIAAQFICEEDLNAQGPFEQLLHGLEFRRSPMLVSRACGLAQARDLWTHSSQDVPCVCGHYAHAQTNQ